MVIKLMITCKHERKRRLCHAREREIERERERER